MVKILYIAILLIIISIIFIYVYKPEKNRIVIIPRGNMFSITTYSNGIVTDMRLVSSRYIKNWFETYKNDKKIDEEGLEFDLESGKPISKKKRGRPKKKED